MFCETSGRHRLPVDLLFKLPDLEPLLEWNEQMRQYVLCLEMKQMQRRVACAHELQHVSLQAHVLPKEAPVPDDLEGGGVRSAGDKSIHQDEKPIFRSGAHEANLCHEAGRVETDNLRNDGGIPFLIEPAYPPLLSAVRRGSPENHARQEVREGVQRSQELLFHVPNTGGDPRKVNPIRG